jgi:hypothetical protein
MTNHEAAQILREALTLGLSNRHDDDPERFGPCVPREYFLLRLQEEKKLLQALCVAIRHTENASKK